MTRSSTFRLFPPLTPSLRVLVRLCLLLVAICLLPGQEAQAMAQQAHNVILMVADGMGLADVTAARLYRGGHDGAPLSFERLPVIGYQRTYSESSVVTDSAAAASAFATGRKHPNGQISCGSNFPSCDSPPATILEIAKGLGKSTGLVATSALTHATPAAFGAHAASRLCEGEIGRQLVARTGVEVLLGGGLGRNARQDGGLCQAYADTTPDEIVDLARTNGYQVVRSKEELLTPSPGSGKVLGLFGTTFKTLETFRLGLESPYPDQEPTLAEMTQAALSRLARNPHGFFLMVEGSQVDWRNHDNDAEGMIGEVLAFDAAVSVVIKQLEAWLVDPRTRRQGTLLIVVSDHETGGFTITGPDKRRAERGQMVNTGWVSKVHTGVDTVVWSQGPGSARLGQAVNNTDIFQVMKEAMAPADEPPAQPPR